MPLAEAPCCTPIRFRFLSPDTYKFWTKAQKRWGERRRAVADDTLAVSHYYQAADMLLRRGFDTVVFGHTHHAEVVELETGTYVNSGNWIRDCTYVDIDRGDVTLHAWDPEETPRSVRSAVHAGSRTRLVAAVSARWSHGLVGRGSGGRP